MPRLIRSLAGRRQKFILFIDDLAFDQDDNTYSIMKTILEGGLERRPANVAIYATSNRRHLVRQSFSDRAGDEVDAFETISEKTALAERFGLRIPYLTMSKADYLALVDHLAARAGVAMSAELLHAQAMTWEIRHAGRTPAHRPAVHRQPVPPGEAVTPGTEELPGRALGRVRGAFARAGGPELSTEGKDRENRDLRGGIE